MSMFLRGISIAGRFPFVRLIQFSENPLYFFHLLKKRFIYRKEADQYLDKYKDFTFLNGQETLVDLIKNGKSLGRYSDGEFDVITGGGIYPPDSNWSQKWSPQLAADLLKVLSCTDPRINIAVDPPETFLAAPGSQHHIPFEYAMWIDMRRMMWKYLTPGVPYGHSHLFIRKNCPDLDWHMLRDHFRSKDIIVATGNVHTLSHLVLGRTTHLIECGTVNAYESKEKIKAAIRDTMLQKRLNKSSTLVLASLGPTAQIIAYELLDENICVWDTGHMFEFADAKFLDGVFQGAAA